jgi:alkylation response protein AidB-like acyl-CoA dehydrogenase
VQFDLNDDERALQDAVRDLCAGRVASARVRAAADTDGVDRALFGELAATGVFGLCLPEVAGGLGLDATHATVVFEELGRFLVPGPTVATHLAAGLVDGAADGTTVVGQVVVGDRVVPHLDALDVLVVVADDGLRQVDPRSVVATRLAHPLDPVTPVWQIGVLPDGDLLGDADAARRWRQRDILLTSALLLGTSLGSLDAMVDYAATRHQFGRAIGSFQAIKHLCADALTRAEVARAAVYAAACEVDGKGGGGDPDTAVAAAALLAAEAAVTNAKTCIQVHGGMGFTWEVDAHLHLKRAMVWSNRVGGAATNEERVAAAL